MATDFSFQTFCIEHNEHISNGQTVTVSLEDGAINGGAGGVKESHSSGGTIGRISKGTAFLYSLFATGELENHGYSYTAGSLRQNTAGQLQNLIWFLEGEITSLGSNIFTSALVGEFGAGWDSYSSAKMDYGTGTKYGVVQAAHLKTSSGGARQDQLYYGGSEDSEKVPDGGLTILLMGLALSSLWGFQKRFAAG